MEVNKIAELVSEILPKVSDPPDIEYLNPESSAYNERMLNHISIPKTYEDSLIDLLREQEELRQLEDYYVHSSPGSKRGVSLIIIARWILAQSRSNNPEEVVKQLEKLISENSVKSTEILVLWGINPTEPVEVCDGIKLVPISQLPKSRNIDSFTGVNTYRYHTGEPFTFRFRPRAALIHEFKHSPVFTHKDSVEDSSYNPSRRSLMEEIINALIILERKPIYPIGHWYQLDDNVCLVGGVRSWSGNYRLDSGFIHEIEPKTYDQALLQTYINNYLKLGQDIKKKLITPIERLNSAMLSNPSRDYLNTAIDLGITLESLLTSDQNDEDSLSFKIRVRGTLLLGGKANIRNWNYKRFRQLYDIRSKAAHRGTVSNMVNYPTIDGNNNRKRIREVFDEGFELCALLIEKIIADGKFPDWNKLVIGTED